MLTRTTAGLLFADDFNRADGAVGANYVVQSGTWVISGNRLKHTIVRNAISILRLAAGTFAARAKMHIQALITRDDTRSFFALTARADANNFYYYEHAASDAGSGQANSSIMNRWAGGGSTNVNVSFVAGPAAVNGGTERLTMFTDAGVEKGWINGASLITAADASAPNAINGVAGFLSFGQTSLPGNIFGYIDDLLVCADRTITVNGLPAGYKIRANGLTSAAAVAATPLVLDLLGTLLPVTLLEVLNGANAVVDSTAIAVYGGDVFTFTPAAQLSATMPLPFVFTGTLRAGRVVRGTLTLPLSLLASIRAGRVLRGTMAMPLSLLARAAARPRWISLDPDPASLWTSEHPSTVVNLGLGPVAGLPRNNVILTPNVSGVYAGILVTYDRVVVNPAGFAGTNGETIQGGTGTGPAPDPPFTVRFSKPIRSFSVTMQQQTFFAGWMSAHDINGVEIGRVLFDLAAWQDHGVLIDGNATLAQTIDLGANRIYSIQLHPDPVDWVAWSDLAFLFNGLGSTWAEDDLAPATAWSN